MLDAAVLDLCAQCLAGAAAYEGHEDDLALSATALARDLADTHKAQAAALIDSASRCATGLLDVSEVEAGSFAAALARLAWIRDRVAANLGGARPSPTD